MREVTVIVPAKNERWDTFVENHPCGWVSHLSGWKQILEKSFKHMKGYYLILLDNQAIKAALPVFEVKSWLTGNRLVSVPFATLCDPLVSSADDMDELLKSTLKLSSERKTSYVEIKSLSSTPFIQDPRLGISYFFNIITCYWTILSSLRKLFIALVYDKGFHELLRAN